MPQPVETESAEIGAGVEPNEAVVGSTAWAVYAAVRAHKAVGDDPMKTSERKKQAHAFEIVEGKKINSDFIRDCYKCGTPQKTSGVYRIGSVRWTVQLLVREIITSNDTPKNAQERRNKILGYEVLDGKEVDEEFEDFIEDCFTDADASQGDGLEHQEGIREFILDPPVIPSLAPQSKAQHSRPAASLDISNQPSSTRLDSSEAFKISLCPDARAPKDTDMVMAQWRKGKENYIVETVAKRHGLEHAGSGFVKARVGKYNERLAAHIAKWIVFQIQPEYKNMADILLGSDFRRGLEDLDQWETASTPGDLARPPLSISSQYSETGSHSARNDTNTREFARQALGTVEKLVSIYAADQPDQDSAYGSMTTSSGSGRQSERRAS